METAQELSSRVRGPSAWRFYLPLSLGAVMLLIGIYWSTLASMVDIWNRSETFTHGFLIFPISGYLIWRQRRVLEQLRPESDSRALFPLVLLEFIWLLARIAGVLVVEQLAFVAMIPTLIWFLLGWRVTFSIAFPLGFLIFAVPMGESLIEPMMNMTAAFVIEAIRLTGIPVYATGTFFSLPSGHWSVVEGCSGVRYLIASITLGTLYAYLNYQSHLKRILFIVAATLLPIVANWLRAFIIVMLGHFSDMKVATGVDHLIYGWVFFGFVILLLFWLGSFWRDPPQEPPASRQTPGAAVLSDKHKMITLRQGGLVAFGIGILILAPIWSQILAMKHVESRTHTLTLPDSGTWISKEEPLANWKPQYLHPTLEVQQSFDGASGAVGLYLAFYAEQRQDSELINSQNLMIRQKHPVWSQLRQEQRGVFEQGKQVSVRETHLSSFNQELLIWHWHELGGYRIGNPYLGKLIEAVLTLKGRSPEGVAYVIYTPLEGKPDSARQRLQRFVDEMVPTIRHEVERQL